MATHDQHGDEPLIARARAIALELAHDWLGTEHAALALLAARDGEAHRALVAEGHDPVALAADLRAAAAPGTATAAAPLAITPRLRDVLELAAAAARELGAARVGEGHVLLALLREPSGHAGAALRARGVDGDAIRTRLAPPPHRP